MRRRAVRVFVRGHAGLAGIQLWMCTGLRTSELFGLTWANVDLAYGSVLISESIVQGVRKERTKTSVTRIVILNSRALAALERQRAQTQLVGGPVFQDPRCGTNGRSGVVTGPLPSISSAFAITAPTTCGTRTRRLCSWPV